ncbi:MAG: hypothetical protein ACI9EH_001287 [Planktomarina sp.]|jgi:hypothetical protein
MRFGPRQNYRAQSKSLILHIIHEIAGHLRGRHDAWLGDFWCQVLCQLQITTNRIPKGANPYRIPNRLCGHVELHAQGRLLNHHGQAQPQHRTINHPAHFVILNKRDEISVGNMAFGRINHSKNTILFVSPACTTG